MHKELTGFYIRQVSMPDMACTFGEFLRKHFPQISFIIEQAEFGTEVAFSVCMAKVSTHREPVLRQMEKAFPA